MSSGYLLVMWNYTWLHKERWFGELHAMEPLADIRQETVLIVDVQLFSIFIRTKNKNQPSCISFSGAKRTEQQWHTTKIRIWFTSEPDGSYLISLNCYLLKSSFFLDYKENVITLEISGDFHNEPYLHCVDTNSNYNHDLQIPM